MFWLRQSTAGKVSVLMRNSDGSNLGGLDGTAQIFKNDGTFETPSDGSWQDDKGRAGWYTVAVDGTDTATLGKFGISASESSALDFDDYGYVITANEYDSRFSTDKQEVDLVQIDGQATNGNNATLKLKALDIRNSAGIAAYISGTNYGIYSVGTNGHGILGYSSGGGGNGIMATGNGSGNGLRAAGGSSGSGIYAQGGSGSGDAMVVIAQAGNGNGLTLTANGSGKDLNATTTDDLEVNITKTNGNAYIDGTIDLTEHFQKVHAAEVNAVSGDGTNLTYKDTDGSTLWTAAYPGTTGTRTVS
jgi:hypothetical protein